MEFRVLTREEAATVPGIMDPQPASMFTVGAVDEHGVVAACGVFLALCADPLWVREDYRNTGKTLMRLWDATRREIADRGGAHLRVTMTEDDPGQPFESIVARLCTHAGGEELHGRVFLVPVTEA